MIELPHDIETFAVIASFWSRWGRWIFLVLAIVAVLGLLWLLVRWVRHRRTKKLESSESAYVRMLNELSHLMRLSASENASERLRVLLGASQIARSFVAHTTHIHSESFTTEEMIRSLKSLLQLEDQEKKIIVDLLRQFDGVKFAGQEWRQEEVLRHMTELREVILQRQKKSEVQGQSRDI